MQNKYKRPKMKEGAKKIKSKERFINAERLQPSNLKLLYKIAFVTAIILCFVTPEITGYRSRSPRRSYSGSRRYGSLSRRTSPRTVYRGGYRYKSAGTSSSTVRQTLVGPNVCGNKCCEGWTSGNTAMCITPICNPSCKNGGHCIRVNVCLCPSSFAGLDCSERKSVGSTSTSHMSKRKRGPRQTLINVRYPGGGSSDLGSSCTPATCFNGGTCVDGSCVCRSGYEGKKCEKVVVVKMSLDSVLPGEDADAEPDFQVALKLCKALCVHGTCTVGAGPVCKCHPGYYGTMCESSQYGRRKKSKSSMVTDNVQSGMKYSNNLLRPVAVYPNKKVTRPIPVATPRISSPSRSSKYGKCYKSYRGDLCGLSYNRIMTAESCCRSGLGDGWGPECLPCRQVVFTQAGRISSNSRLSTHHHCPKGFKSVNAVCKDVNECLTKRNLCENGVCINSRGSFWCRCHRGYHQHPSRSMCLPDRASQTRVSVGSHDLCYLALDRDGGCGRLGSAVKGNKAVCCCSVGLAWGPNCERCPIRGSAEHAKLCPSGSGYFKSVSYARSPKRPVSVPGTSSYSPKPSIRAPTYSRDSKKGISRIFSRVKPRTDTPSRTRLNNYLFKPARRFEPKSTTTTKTKTTTTTIPTTTRKTTTTTTTMPTTDSKIPPTKSTRSITAATTPISTSTPRVKTNSPISNSILITVSPAANLTQDKTSTVAKSPKTTTERTTSAPVYSNVSVMTKPVPERTSTATTSTVTKSASSTTTEPRISTKKISSPLTSKSTTTTETTTTAAKTTTITTTTRPTTTSTSTTSTTTTSTRSSVPTITSRSSTTTSTSTTSTVAAKTNPVIPADKAVFIPNLASPSKKLPARKPDPRTLVVTSSGTTTSTHPATTTPRVKSTTIAVTEESATLPEDKEMSEMLDMDDEEYYDSFEILEAEIDNEILEDESYDIDGELDLDSSKETLAFPTSTERTTTKSVQSSNMDGESENSPIEPELQPVLNGNSESLDPEDTIGTINACSSNPCLNEAECMLEDNPSFKCKCREGYFGTTCQTKDYCVPNHCKNGATCETGMDFYYCVCPEGYRGKDCDERISQCESSPCVHGTCRDVGDRYVCMCEGGFKGRNCEEDIDECTLNICDKSSKCVNSMGSFQCTCEDGFKLADDGISCQDGDECLNSTICGDHGKCINTKGSYQCECFMGYVFKNGFCEDLVECDITDCGEVATCRNFPGGYECSCPNFGETYDLQTKTCIPPVTEPPKPEEIRKPCYSTPRFCVNKLSENVTQSECCCTLGRSWGDCDSKEACPAVMTSEFKELCPVGRGLTSDENKFNVQDLNECELFGNEKICRNGKCTNSFGGYKCVCYKGFYYNPRIQACDDMNECRMRPRNKCIGGFCINKPGSFECKCPGGTAPRTGRFGTTCVGTQSRRRLPGFYRFRQRNRNQKSDPTEETGQVDFCFNRILSNSMCSAQFPSKHTYKQCCCTMGIAWGSSCSRCPEKTSDDYRFLCQNVMTRMRPLPRMISAAKEKTSDVDEVAGFHEQECGIPGGCKNGKCLRTEEGYTCDCNDGFILDPDLMVCSDVDECKDLEHVCLNGICINEPGSFKCVCRPGFKPSNDDSTICKPIESVSNIKDSLESTEEIDWPET